MTSLFPSLFIFFVVILFVVRVGIALFLIREAYQAHKKKATLFPHFVARYVSPLFALLLLLGFLTQGVALIMAGTIIRMLSRKELSYEERMMSFFLLLLFLVLLFGGPGFLAIDLPL